MYLIINWNIKDLAAQVPIQPDQKLEAVVNKYVSAYTEKGMMPPAEISSAILNLADDQMAGRPMTFRAGDYIALQNYARKNG